jgi:hypothetical protein
LERRFIIVILLAVVVHYLNLVNIARRPTKAHSPLAINTDTPLSAAPALETLQAIAGRGAQIRDCPGIGEHPELASGDPLHVYGQAAGALTAPDAFGLRAGETPYHTLDYTP